MADINNSIALQVQTPNMMNTMGSMLNVAQGIQQTKQGQMDLQERQALRQLSQNLDAYKGQDGSLDLTKLTNDATQAAPKLGMEFARNIAAAHVEGIAVNKALTEVSEQQRGVIGQMVASLAERPFEEQQKVIGSYVNANPRLKIAGDVAIKHLKSAWENGGPEAAKNTAYQIAKGVVSVPTQNQLGTPNLVNSADPQGNPVYRDINPMTTKQPMPSGPNLGVAQNVGGTVDTINKHYQETVNEAQKAAQDVGLLQNIKKYAPGAITGVASDRRAYMAGLAGLLGMDAQQLSKTNTDSLAKETNMLALAGGDTNLAKMMAESANPNTHMTPEAIIRAANRVISMKEMAIEKQHYFQQLKSDPNNYNNQLSEWSSHADPRILQYPHMSQTEKQEMRHAMDPKEAVKFKSDLQWFQDKGILR